MASLLQGFLFSLSLCCLAKACLTLGTGVLSCQDPQCPRCEAEPWEAWREHSGKEPMFRKELLEMLTSTAQWCWDLLGTAGGQCITNTEQECPASLSREAQLPGPL